MRVEAKQVKFKAHLRNMKKDKGHRRVRGWDFFYTTLICAEQATTLATNHKDWKQDQFNTVWIAN